jgi:hypothetical protein
MVSTVICTPGVYPQPSIELKVSFAPPFISPSSWKHVSTAGLIFSTTPSNSTSGFSTRFRNLLRGQVLFLALSPRLSCVGSSCVRASSSSCHTCYGNPKLNSSRARDDRLRGPIPSSHMATSSQDHPPTNRKMVLP